jgi:SAM-dependent methyltransferase
MGRKQMMRSRWVYLVAMASSLAVLTAAERPQTAQAPAAAEKPFEPYSGQPGKDVVWVPSPDVLVGRMLDMAQVTPNDFVIDLGSGDGRTVIAAAKRGATALGIEYEPPMVDLSRKRAVEAGVSDRAAFVKADIFESDFSNASVLTMFLLPSLNLKLRPTILDMKPGTRIVSNSFTMEDWEPDDRFQIEDGCTSWCTAMLWYVPAKVGGTWQLGNERLVLNQTFQMVKGTLGTTAVEGRLRGSAITFTAGARKFNGSVVGKMMAGTIAGATPESWTATMTAAAAPAAPAPAAQ